MVLQPSWCLGREAAATLEQHSRGTAWHPARWDQANLCAGVRADRCQSRCAEQGRQSRELLGGRPGSQAVPEPRLPAAEPAVAACLSHTALSPSSWVGWHQGRGAAYPTATTKIVPKKEQLGSSSLGFVTLATCQW